MAPGTARICTRFSAFRFFDNRLREGIPVRAKDFSQSCEEGPRMLPSTYASPGQRVQLPACVHWEQLGKSFNRIERTSLSWSDWRQISMKRCRLTLPLGSGNWTQG